MRIFLYMAIVALMNLASHAHGELIALDNTNNLASTPATNLGSITTFSWNAKVFTVGSADAVMKELVLPLYDTTSASRTINLRLFAVDGSDNPTGTVLASDSFTQSFTNTATFYTIATTLGGYTMPSGQKYALVINSDAPSTSMSWSGVSNSGNYPVYSPAAGWTFNANKRTTNSGNSWSNNTYYNGMMMTVTPVPEPSTVILTGLAFGGLAIARARRFARAA